MKNLIVCLVFLVMMVGCSTVHKSTHSRRTAIEQLLLTEAVTNSLPQQLESPLPIPQGENVSIEISGISSDKNVVEQIMAGWLGQQGYHVQSDKQKVAYQISAVVESLGTETGDTFIGMPPIQGSLVPISLPELVLYKAQYQTGYAKVYLNIFELPSGRFIQSTPPFLAETYYNDYTFLFILTFKSTNLISPPQLGIGMFRKPLSAQVKDEKSLPSKYQQ